MGFDRAPFKHIWKLGISLYLFLLICSHLFIRLSIHDELNTTEFSQSKSDITVLYFRDPIISINEFDESILEELDLLTVPITIDDSISSYSKIVNYSAQIIDSLNLNSVHIVGNGIGGSLAIKFAQKFPEITKSLSLIAANGAIEFELLGGYHLNQAVYGAKHLFFNFIHLFTPHFGKFEKLNDRILRTKIQYNSDQRLIRDALKDVNMPVLIMHPYESVVPLQSAKESYRLIPQSILNVYEKGNVTLNNDLIEFIKSQKIKSEPILITEERISQSILPFDEKNGIKAEGKALFILILIIVLSTLISEDLTCIGTGLMIARGLIGFWPGTLACLFGIFIGDILLYLAGRLLASSTLHKAPLKWFISEKDIQKSYYWFEAKGPSIIIASRFIPGTRFPTYFSAGAIGANFWMFILYFGVASIIWTPILVGLAVLLGNQMMSYFGLYQEYALWVLIGVLSITFMLFKFIIPMFTFRGRRILLGKWKRFTNWEFWSPFIPYFFVILYVIILWIKYRSVTIFTLANPAIPDGGFIKESKNKILNGIAATESVARYLLVQKEEKVFDKLSIIDGYMNKLKLDFPIVIKPDVGERGRGVFIPKTKKELKKVIINLDTDLIVQEYIEGEEYGIFYYRYPKDESGKILSVTKKVYLELYGDGIHTLEELILKDHRAVCLAEIHFDKHINDLYKVPDEGEVIQLVELGTHSRGAIFYDGNELITRELTEEIDRISKSYDGFYFGRYDIKVPSKDELLKGSNIKIIEVNGVTSESTNIYDPKHSFFYGIKVLMNQWKIVYEIGSQVKAENPYLKTPGISHMISLLR